MKNWKPILAAMMSAAILTGCAAVAGGTAGALIADEGFNENDGEFDPLERTELGKKIYD